MIEGSQNSAKQFNDIFKSACDKNRTFLLDGSMGSYLHRQCKVPRHPTLWMLPSLIQEKHHETIIKAHKAYIDAGCDIIETFNYPCVPLYLKKGKCQDKINELNQTAAILARKAINQHYIQNQQQKGRKIWLAGSLPTPGQSYYDCQDMSEEEFDKTFKAIIESIDKYCDFFLAQTIGSSRDAYLIAKAAYKYAPQKILFMSFTINQKEVLSSNETLTKAIEYLEQQKVNIAGYGVNCCTFMLTGKFLKQMRRVTKKPLVVYPNFFQNFQEGYKPTQSKGKIRTMMQIKDEDYLVEMKNFLDSDKGIVMIGGCCGFNPTRIGLLRKLVPEIEI